MDDFVFRILLAFRRLTGHALMIHTQNYKAQIFIGLLAIKHKRKNTEMFP